MSIKRPLLRYHGSKFQLAPWIISHFPSHTVYLEAFGGGASILLRKKRSKAEIYNDLDQDVVNLFRVLRTDGQELERLLRYTPYSRDEFMASYEAVDDDLERARRSIVRSFFGFGNTAASGNKVGFRSNNNRAGTAPARVWQNYVDVLPEIIERLRGVVIENKDASEVMVQQDSDKTLHLPGSSVCQKHALPWQQNRRL